MTDPTGRRRHHLLPLLQPHQHLATTTSSLPLRPQSPPLLMQHPQLPPRPPPSPPAATAFPQQAQKQLQGFGSAQSPAAAAARARVVEQQMAAEDVWKACNPDYKTPFASVEDAVSRLLPYHVFADYESDEDDEMFTIHNATGEPRSRAQLWDDTVAGKTEELWAEYEKQLLIFNIMARKRAEGVARAEEKLTLERALLEDERQAYLRTRAAVEEREKAEREVALARVAMTAQADGARAREEASRGPAEVAWPLMGARHAALHGEAGGSSSSQNVRQDQQQLEGQRNASGVGMMHCWGSAQRKE